MADAYYRSKRTAPNEAESAIRALARFYGNGSGGLRGLEPDLVGEHLVVSEADWDLMHALQLIEACLGWDDGSKARWKHVLTVLNRASKAEHGTKARLAELLLVEVVSRYAVDLAPVLVEVALAEPEGRLPGAIVTAIQRLDEEALEALEAVIPFQTFRLMDAAHAVAVRQLELARVSRCARNAEEKSEQGDAAVSNLAARVGTLGIRVSDLGRREEAFAASTRPSTSIGAGSG